MKKKAVTRLVIGAAAAIAALALAFVPALASAESEAKPVDQQEQSQKSPADGTPQGAIEWYQEREGSSEYEGMCEMAAENAYGTTGVWPSAIDHWNATNEAGTAHPGDTNPPLGAFVFWNTSEYGHVGVADGNGGFWASSVGGAIGHSDDLGYYGDVYLGWSDPQVPAGKGELPEGTRQH